MIPGFWTQSFYRFYSKFFYGVWLSVDVHVALVSTLYELVFVVLRLDRRKYYKVAFIIFVVLIIVWICIIFTKHVTVDHDNKQSLLLLNSRYSCCFLLSIEMVNCLWIGVGNICCYYYFIEGSDHNINLSLSENISLKKTVKLIHAMTFYLRAISRSFKITFF